MIQSIKKSKKARAILIKFPKKKQDLRTRFTNCGLDTLKDCKKVNIKGNSIKS